MKPLRVVLALALIAAAFAAVPGHAAAGAEGVPAYDHVAIIVLENQNFDASWGPASVAHYLNSLRGQGVFDDLYFGIGHVSLDNYIAMISGQPANPLSGTDCLAVNLWLCVQPQRLMTRGRNLADQLENHGRSWKGYMDAMPSPCFHADYAPTARPPDPYQGNSTAPPAKDYADRHNPFIYFPDIIENDARCKAHVRPYPDLAADLASGTLPSFSFITPDTCHDGHDAPCANGAPGGLTSADAWLQQEVPPLLAYLRAHNGLLIITFDENGFSDVPPIGCCHGGPGGLPGFGGQIGLLAIGTGVTPGKVVHIRYDHMNLLRTFEDAFGISTYLNNAALARPMAGLFVP
jgi:phospholipase C